MVQATSPSFANQVDQITETTEIFHGVGAGFRDAKSDARGKHAHEREIEAPARPRTKVAVNEMEAEWKYRKYHGKRWSTRGSKYSRLVKGNSSEFQGEPDDQVSQRQQSTDDQRVVQALGSQLDLGQPVVDYAVSLIKNLSDRRYGRGYSDIHEQAMVALAIAHRTLLSDDQLKLGKFFATEEAGPIVTTDRYWQLVDDVLDGSFDSRKVEQIHDKLWPEKPSPWMDG